MANSLKIVNNYTASIDGNTYTGKQGEVDDALSKEYAITVTQPAHIVPFTLAHDSKVTLWDDDDDVPASFDYFFLVADGDLFLQLVGTTTNVTLKVKAKVPFVLSYNSILAAANTTDLSTGADPSVTALDHVLVLNRSGNSVKGLASFFD